MKLTVIGFWGGFPAAGAATSGYLVEHEGFHLLIDCGSGILSQLQKYTDIASIDAVILSHYHHDHVADVGPLQYGRLVHGLLAEDGLPTLPIYAHKQGKVAFNKLTYKDITKGVAYAPDKSLTIGPFQIEFLDTKHPVTCYAIKITRGSQAVVYTADTSYFPELVPFAKNADLLIAESSFYVDQDGSKAGHMTSAEAGTLAQKSQAGRLLLTHLPHFGDHQQLIKEAAEHYDGQIELAKSGWVWNR